ncbi:MAG: hypothetical protein KC620_19145, partial [Myxococcales bacterium]|nr:hypothetical protein [Myxococcales bacterium]
MRAWAVAAGLGLWATGCIENGPLVLAPPAGDRGADAAPLADAGPGVDAEADSGPPMIACATDEDCAGLDPTGRADLRCVGAVCVIVDCNHEHLVDANRDVTDGCECLPTPGGEGGLCDDKDGDCDGRVDEDTDLRSDVDNCGGCGVRCADGLMLEAANIESVVCREGSCGIGACREGWFNPNGRLATGCLCVGRVPVAPLPLALPDDALFGPIFNDDEGRRRPPRDPSLAYDRDGTGVLVWGRVGNGPPADWVIRMMRVDADGFPLGPAHTIGQYSVRGDAAIEGVYAVGGRTFIVLTHYDDMDGHDHVHRIRVSYAGVVGDAAPAIDRHEYSFPVDQFARVDYAAAPGGDELCVAYRTAPDPDTKDRAIVMVGPAGVEMGPGGTVAEIPAIRDEAGEPLPRAVAL